MSVKKQKYVFVWSPDPRHVDGSPDEVDPWFYTGNNYGPTQDLQKAQVYSRHQGRRIAISLKKDFGLDFDYKLITYEEALVRIALNG